ncbi:MAG: DoxX family protein [Hyphomicrobiaceae bacterium]
MKRIADIAASIEYRGTQWSEAAERTLDGWFPSLLARLIFLAVLFGYYWNSALTKIGEGPLGFLEITDSAYIQILPSVMEANGYDSSSIAFIPWGLIATLGTWFEFLLPILIVIGLFTRLAALGMLVFIAVQSFVDIAFHGVDAETIGALFDRFPSSTIVDQRTLWAFLLVTLVVKGGGAISLDAFIRRTLRARTAVAETLSPSH